MDKRLLPYITAALLCEKVLKEDNGSLSVIRIADKVDWALEGPGVPPGAKPLVPMEGLIALKSGPVKGDFTLTLKVITPSGKVRDANSLPIKLGGSDQGQNIILKFGLPVEEEGLHWFELLFEDEPLTRIPLMVVQKRASEMGLKIQKKEQ